jgi:hypothetical protein
MRTAYSDESQRCVDLFFYVMTIFFGILDETQIARCLARFISPACNIFAGLITQV